MTQADPTPDCAAEQPSRRTFVQLATLAGGAALFGSAAPAARAGGHTEAILLSCMDFRLMDEIERYMSGRGLRDNYDHVVLAGASLGAVTDKYPAWNKTFWEHLGIAIKLHHIEKVIVIDHRDCGAYKVILGPEHAKDRDLEKTTHAEQLNRLATLIRKEHPHLHVEKLLMSLDGAVEVIA